MELRSKGVIKLIMSFIHASVSLCVSLCVYTFVHASACICTCSAGSE